jgi:hypothetical protein
MDDSALAALAGAAIGSLATGIAPLITGLSDKWRETDRHQRAIARELIGLFERLNRLHTPSSNIASEEQFHITEEIVVRSLELVDSQLRQHIAALIEAAVFALQPYLHPDPAADVSVSSVGLMSVRNAARAILGPVLRGEAVPKELPAGARGFVEMAQRKGVEIDEMIAILSGPR